MKPEEVFQCLNRLCIFCGTQKSSGHGCGSKCFSALTGFVSSVGEDNIMIIIIILRFSALTGFVSSVGSSNRPILIDNDTYVSVP